MQILSCIVVKYLQVTLNLANIILYCCQISARDVKYLQILSFLVVQYLQVMLNLILLSNMFKYYRILPSTICKCYLFLLSNICWWCNLNVNHLQILSYIVEIFTNVILLSNICRRKLSYFSNSFSTCQIFANRISQLIQDRVQKNP